MTIGGIEAGGTKWVCAIVGHDRDILAETTLPTTTPAETLDAAAGFFLDHGVPEAIGVGSFGPLDLRASSPTYGQITTTPKPGWSHTDVVANLRDRLGAPVALDTDVNAAAIAEWRWGAGAGLDTFCYITVGTGIGGGAFVKGRPLHGLVHPEFGHLRTPHDRGRDPFEGCCPYHGDCLEGLASGEAMRRRWGRPAEVLDDDAAWELEAEYLAFGLVNVVQVLSPQRIIMGGGVSHRPGLVPLVRARLAGLVAGYLDSPEFTGGSATDAYLVTPALGDRSGVLGAAELGRDLLNTLNGAAL